MESSVEGIYIFEKFFLKLYYLSLGRKDDKILKIIFEKIPLKVLTDNLMTVYA